MLSLLLLLPAACQCNENGTVDDGQCNELVSVIAYRYVYIQQCTIMYTTISVIYVPIYCLNECNSTCITSYMRITIFDACVRVVLIIRLVTAI